MNETTTTELTTPQDPKLVEFNKLKATIDTQVSNLLKIKVTDNASLIIANQQLSSAKVLDKEIDNRHASVKEESLRFCQSADLAKRTLKEPLAPAVGHVQKEILNWDVKETARKAKEVADLEEKQAELLLEAEQTRQNLIKQMGEFEARAFKLINDATESRELSFVYTNYVIAFPPVYDPLIKERVMTLGKAKLDAIQHTNPIFIEAYQDLYNLCIGTKPTVAPPAEAIPMPSFEAIEVKKEMIMSSGPSNIKKSWEHEVIDMSQMSMSWLMPNDSNIKAFIKTAKDSLVDGEIINGVKFFQVSSVKTK